MRVLMIAPKTNYPTPGLSLDMPAQGPAYIAGSLKAHGHEVKGVNISYDPSPEPAPQVLERHLRKAISEFEPDIIATGGMAAEYLFISHSIELSRIIAPHTPIVCGGGIMTNDRVHAFDLLKPDYAVVDEGEYVIIDLLDRLSKGESMEGCGGVDYLKDGKRVVNCIRTPIDDLDAIPLPDYEFMEVETFFDIFAQGRDNFHVRTRKRPRMLPILTGRSCPFKCTFCQYSTLEGSRRKYRGRSMQNVIEEVQHFHDLYQFNILKIYDDLFSVKEHRIREFCELIKETKLDIHWNASMRVGDVSLDLLKEMKDAGCIHIGYGFESASNDVLHSMAKRIKVDQIERAIRLSEEAGIGCQGNFIYGDPAETEETVQETKEFADRMCRHHIVHQDYVMPYPGSPIFDHSLAIGAIKDRKKYYETIHMRPRYNMTKMKTQDYFRSIDPVVNEFMVDLKFASNVQFKEAPREGFEHEYFADKLLIETHADCPHCKKQNEYIFPFSQSEFQSGRDGMLKPLRFYCGHCHKRLVISLLPLVGLQEEMTNFIEKTKKLAEDGTTVTISPFPGRANLDTFEGYGFPKDDLSIMSMISMDRIGEGVEFEGVRVASVHHGEIERFAATHHIVLPFQDAPKVIALLLTKGVHPKEMTTFDCDMKAAIELLKSNQSQQAPLAAE